MSLSSMLIGQPVPILEYLSSQNAIQNVLRLSSRSVQSLGGGRLCFTSRPAPSSRWRPILEICPDQPAPPFPRTQYDFYARIQEVILHLTEPDRGSSIHPRPWEIHHFEFVARE